MLFSRLENDAMMRENADGACDHDSGCFGCGGLLRNSDGAWVLRFSKFLRNCSMFKVESWGLMEGVRCAIDLGIENLEIACDSALLVNAAVDSRPVGAEIDGIIRAINGLLRNIGC